MWGAAYKGQTVDKLGHKMEDYDRDCGRNNDKNRGRKNDNYRGKNNDSHRGKNNDRYQEKGKDKGRYDMGTCGMLEKGTSYYKNQAKMWISRR